MNAHVLAGSAATPHGHAAPESAAAHARWLGRLCTVIEHFCGLVLAVDVGVVFVSVILRYFLHSPVDWAEEAARGLMVTLVFLGGATVLARRQHVGIEVFRGLLPAAWREPAVQLGGWAVAGTSAALCYSSWELLLDSVNVTTLWLTPISTVAL